MGHSVFAVLFPLNAGPNEVSVKCDVDVHVVAVDGVFPLPLVQADPHLVAQLQVQHHTLALHDGAVGRLGVQDGLLRVVLHDVQIRLFEVPRVDVDVEEVDARDVAGKLAVEHVEVLVRVDEHSVEHKGLVGLQAVEGLSTADGEGGVMGFAGITGKPCLALAASGTWSTSGAWRAFGSSFTRCSSVATIPFVALTQSRGKLSVDTVIASYTIR